MDTLTFTIPEILSLIGVTQCVYILVYMSFRAGRLSRAALPMAYFSVLGLAFAIDFAASAAPQLLPHYFYMQWALWFSGPPLSVLLILQIAALSDLPPLRYYGVLLLLPLAALVSVFYAHINLGGACFGDPPCLELRQWLTLTGIIAGALSLLAIWIKREEIATIIARRTGSSARLLERAGRERYWLILALIGVNCFMLALMLGSFSPSLKPESLMLIRTILGLAFVYLVNTSLFRIYPQGVQLAALGQTPPGDLTPAEHEIARKITDLMQMQKVYQEPSYSRADLARECGAPESIVSRVINVHFGKTFPQMVNEARIADAKQLLAQTQAPVKTVAEEVGFNSLPSFNRVFKEITGLAPSQYRKNQTGG